MGNAEVCRFASAFERKFSRAFEQDQLASEPLQVERVRRMIICES